MQTSNSNAQFGRPDVNLICKLFSSTVHPFEKDEWLYQSITGAVRTKDSLPHSHSSLRTKKATLQQAGPVHLLYKQFACFGQRPAEKIESSNTTHHIKYIA